MLGATKAKTLTASVAHVRVVACFRVKSGFSLATSLMSSGALGGRPGSVIAQLRKASKVLILKALLSGAAKLPVGPSNRRPDTSARETQKKISSRSTGSKLKIDVQVTEFNLLQAFRVADDGHSSTHGPARPSDPSRSSTQTHTTHSIASHPFQPTCLQPQLKAICSLSRHVAGPSVSRAFLSLSNLNATCAAVAL